MGGKGGSGSVAVDKTPATEQLKGLDRRLVDVVTVEEEEVRALPASVEARSRRRLGGTSVVDAIPSSGEEEVVVVGKLIGCGA